MNISRRALVLLLWPAFCGLVVGGGLGFITGSLSAGLLFAGIAAVVSLLMLNGWDLENIAGSEHHRALASDPRYSHVPGNIAYWDREAHCSVFDESPDYYVDPAFAQLAGNVWHDSSNTDTHSAYEDAPR